MPTPHPFALLFPTISSLLLQLIPPMDQHKHRSLTSISTSALQFLLLHLPAPCFALAFLVSVFPHRLAAASHSDVPECPSTCNKLPIQYPFGGRIGCGSPGFQLNCDGFSAHWVLPDQLELQITEINYNSHSFVVRDPAMSICNHVRPAPKLNLQQFNFSSLTVASLSVAKNLHILVFDCKNLATFPALARTSGSHVDGFIFSSPTCISYSSSCLKEGSLEISPTCFDTDSINADIDKLVRNYSCSAYTSFYNLPSTPNPSSFSLNNMGVQLQWSNVSNNSLCKRCMITNGTCGYEIEGNQSFRCFCSGGNYSYTDCFASRLFKVREYGCNSIRCGYRLKLVIAIPLVVFSALLATLIWAILRFKRKRMHSSSTPNGFSVDIGLAEKPLEFSYKALAIATNFFSLKLGEGAFGVVYKGVLRNGDSVAVKVLDGSRQGDKQFVNEVASIGTIHHVNLVKLVGFCYENSNRILVYEYIVNSSLDKHLFTERKPRLVLDLNRRYSIAMGTAHGLAYLHRYCRKRIIHCDIKPQNILLDADFCPKIADFGLAKLMNRDESRALTTVRGTPGYIAPELWSLRDGPVTEKCDVYSFGMLLFEIIGGRRNMDLEASISQLYFPEWVFNNLGKELDVLVQLVDERIAGGATTGDREQVRMMCVVALWCIQEEASMRPSMSRVVQYLEGSVEVPLHPPFPFKSRSGGVDGRRSQNLTCSRSSSF